ncbi:MAG: NADH-quinone oxidoreductase subunit K [Bdellovibrionales bacterium RIFOXYD12_FULL_39_22]|nr:MAG: NADH-quinone oxidoreductase subunit K [Bdellovibrionales bacterium RIFOXYB1_FULL_39_21]OFZ44238.1 MAG: NADH-quinone oxidoreductase subunit K [Bdellovibrionales bacterium RIFOXYC12_FULL_39_17]OFZ46780.1 MAG: NADH-quinone oxidoreductase subunit K [Bdellovibrionales bacterium RIFOXYC1_FULL_39_130]OFZ75943.1 MAG: NADH-quinone oxidoreductase subunit K [Bdellovibrionales bacterium RIFOXYD1_FULL_39_84]OFZ95459.1 MAG: NADH-quinone oxidoreductase subunit K [Bdellovibrionales bacterium RIFOXYD12_
MYITNELFIQILAAFLFMMGMLIVVQRRNTIMVLMGIELMLNAANLSMVGFSHYLSQIDGQVQVFFTITIAAAESAVGLSILINLFRNFGSSKTGEASILRG